jgi:hypothetical protein
VQYVSTPVHADPSDLPVTVAGDHVILVHMAMASGIDLAGAPTYTGPTAFSVGYPAVAGLARVGDFEAVLTWAIGVTTMPPFKVTTLTDPPRLVIDIASAGLAA